jgi:pyoverdine/dityrosine biosynthesis protein Dit1
MAREVLQFTFRHRRLLDLTTPCLDEPCDLCFAPHIGRMQSFVERQEPIHFVILAFPSKSPNTQKVLGTLPDLAERAALEFLQSFCDQLSYYHAPGARITICSDGHVFAQTVGITDEDATAYHAELEAIIAAQGAASIDFFSLSDAYGSIPYPRMREKLELDYAEDIDLIRKRVTAEDGAARQLFNGIHRFLFEDNAAIHLERSRNRVREEAKALAYAVIRRSNAWSRLIEARFPRAVRLSIHPQPAHADKLGIHLLRTRDNWLTPWHGVALESSDGLVLVKRFQAEQAKARLVWRHNRPSHYVAPHLTLEEITS